MMARFKMFKLNLNQANLVIFLLVGSLAGLCLASIDRAGPIQVTNSGPSYDLSSDDVERVRLPIGGSADDVKPSPNRSPATADDSANKNKDSDDATPEIGRVLIRRIFVVPMIPPSSSSDNNDQDSPMGPPSLSDSMLPFMMMRPVSRMEPEDANPDSDKPVTRHPLWPFFNQSPIASKPPRRHHLFGADEASRSPSQKESAPTSSSKPTAEGEREEASTNSEVAKPMADPIHMLVRMMLDTINQAHQQMSTADNGSPFDNTHKLFNDLNKEASSTPTSSENSSGQESKRQLPRSRNETREDVVVLDGKKFVRKTIMQRHEGENMVFVTKRLIFVPMNETETENPASSTTATPNLISSASPTSVPTKKQENSPTTTGASVSPKIDESTTTTSAPPPSTTTLVSSTAGSTEAGETNPRS